MVNSSLRRRRFTTFRWCCLCFVLLSLHINSQKTLQGQKVNICSWCLFSGGWRWKGDEGRAVKERIGGTESFSLQPGGQLSSRASPTLNPNALPVRLQVSTAWGPVIGRHMVIANTEQSPYSVAHFYICHLFTYFFIVLALTAKHLHLRERGKSPKSQSWHH